MTEIPMATTQRAYTLRLRGVDPSDNSWCDALWATHETVNKGAKVFGDWLLTLRGGLDHALADAPVKEKGGGTRAPTEDERRNRRILLALSWLSVEDAHGAPPDESLIAAKWTDSTDCRARKLCDALVAILTKRGVADSELGEVNKDPEDQPATWLGTCMSSLSAAIKEKAVWVNRSAAFDGFTDRTGGHSDRDYAARTILGFLELKGPYFELPSLSAEDSAVSARPLEEKPLVNEATGWLCDNWGFGAKSDKSRISDILTKLAVDLEYFAGKSGGELVREFCRRAGITATCSSEADSLKALIGAVGWKGRKSAGRMVLESVAAAKSLSAEAIAKLRHKFDKEAADKLAELTNAVPAWMNSERVELERLIGMPYRTSKDHTFEFAVMLDHALRKLSSAHTWIKNAEAERRRFESEAKRVGSVPPNALEWLRKYCESRTDTSGALDGYRIRRRAIDGWEKVVHAWAALGANASRQQRIEAARNVQANLDDSEKFGDIQLFAGFGDEDEPKPNECLADDAALCVWKAYGEATAQPLKDFVAATEAEAKKKQFKVPAYRHPDPLRHPIFTDFGNSRWGIDYSAHRAAAQREGLQQKTKKLSEALSEAQRKLASATERQRRARQEKANDCSCKLCEAEQRFDAICDPHRLELNVWNGDTIETASFRWSSKRLIRDLSLRPNNEVPPVGGIHVSRADRLGRAAVAADGGAQVTIAGLFEAAHWNGRLQAPRAQLDAIARHVEKYGWDAKAREMRSQIRWLLSFSAELAQLGPWTEYCDRFLDTAPARPFIAKSGGYGVKHLGNDQRRAHAKLILSRLPGLRILSVDLGHRFAAACAVWETLALTTMKAEVAGRKIIGGGSRGSDLYCHTRHLAKNAAERTTIYRRIGPDTLGDGSPHPAPWARLDRQFLVKLQGEDRPARKASPAEIEAVAQFEQWAGRPRAANDPVRSLAVDMLMSDAVRAARLAVARHGRHARIAEALTGVRGEQADGGGAIERLADALCNWHDLATDARWNDTCARELWNKWLAELPGGFGMSQPDEACSAGEGPTNTNRREAAKQLRARLQPLAEAISSKEQIREEIHDAWCARWGSDDIEWRRKLKWLSHWLMPRNLSCVVDVVKHDGRRVKRRRSIRAAVAAASNVGGLSLRRLATLTEFRRKVQVGYFTRLRPDGSRAEIGPHFGQSTLDTIQRLKEQRVKQLASRIVEAALGIAAEQVPVWDDEKKKWRDPKRPQHRHADHRFAPCHAVVIEDLSHYRPEETSMRRENRATMDWKSAETRKRLADHCQLYGLYLRDVNPQYTSRQDSRTGLPGARCDDVTVADFLCKPWWRKAVKRAKERAQNPTRDKPYDAEARLLVAIDAIWPDWKTVPEAELATYAAKIESATPIRLITRGGSLFVTAPPYSCMNGEHVPCSLCDGSRTIQSDLNAAANIGLRALLDPDWPGRWWYLPAVLDDHGYRVPNDEKCSGAACLEGWRVAQVRHGYATQGTPLLPAEERDVKRAQASFDEARRTLTEARSKLKAAKKAKSTESVTEATANVEAAAAVAKAAKANLNDAKKAGRAKSHINLWRDPSVQSLASGVWVEYREYQTKVQNRVIQTLRRHAGLATEGIQVPSSSSEISELPAVTPSDRPFQVEH